MRPLGWKVRPWQIHKNRSRYSLKDVDLCYLDILLGCMVSIFEMGLKMDVYWG